MGHQVVFLALDVSVKNNKDIESFGLHTLEEKPEIHYK